MTSAQLPATRPGPLTVSPDALVAVLFPRRASPSYPAAVGIAHSADAYRDVIAGKAVSHLAEFGRSPPQATAAVALLSLVGDWRGVLVFVAGRPIGSAWGAVCNLAIWLQCYVEASACPDRRAACSMVDRQLFDDGRKHPPALFPCRHVLRLVPHPLSRLHPSSEVDQIAAIAVCHGCAACPLFDASAFRWLPDGESEAPMPASDYQARYDVAAKAYEKAFGVWPPVHLACPSISPEKICEMVETALAEGREIRAIDWPPVEPDVIY